MDQGSLEPICGEGGIRTRETLLAFTHFPGVPLQPLEHLSFAISGAKVTHFIDVCNTLRRKMQVEGCYGSPLLMCERSRYHHAHVTSIGLKSPGFIHNMPYNILLEDPPLTPLGDVGTDN